MGIRFAFVLILIGACTPAQKTTSESDDIESGDEQGGKTPNRNDDTDEPSGSGGKSSGSSGGSNASSGGVTGTGSNGSDAGSGSQAAVCATESTKSTCHDCCTKNFPAGDSVAQKLMEELFECENKLCPSCDVEEPGDECFECVKAKAKGCGETYDKKCAADKGCSALEACMGKTCKDKPSK